jgi:ribosomal protein L29
MKKITKEFEDKTIVMLEKETGELRKEMALMTVNAQVNPAKDTNTIMKKKKRLAVLLTVVNHKKRIDQIKKIK